MRSQLIVVSLFVISRKKELVGRLHDIQNKKEYEKKQRALASKNYEKIMKKVDPLKKKALFANEKRNFKKAVKFWENSIVELNNAKVEARKFNPTLVKGIDKLIRDLKVDIQNAITLEREQNTYRALVGFSEKYPRITLRELADKVKIGEDEVKKIVKRFIKNKVIPANYDDASKGIEFLGVMDEIDKLMKTFEEWSKKIGDKKI